MFHLDITVVILLAILVWFADTAITRAIGHDWIRAIAYGIVALVALLVLVGVQQL